MRQNYFLFLILIVNFVGCTTVHKPQTQAITAISVGGEEISFANEKDMGWIEAETKKVWVNSHVDENGNMVAGHFKYVIFTPGHWAAKDGG